MRATRRCATRVHSSEEAQNTFEYVLVIGSVVIAFVAGFLAFDAVIPQVVGLVCPSVDTANALSAIGNCIGT